MKENIIYTDANTKQYIEIIDTDEKRSLYFGKKTLQSQHNIKAPHLLSLSYTQYMAAAFLLLPHPPEKILLIGLGGGSLVRFFRYFFPACSIVIIEKEQQVIDLATTYFHIHQDSCTKLVCADGYDYLNTSTPKEYDLIFTDAFDSDGMSQEIYTHSFFTLLASNIKTDSVLCSNIWSGDDGTLFNVQQGIRSCFESTIFLPVTGRGNIVSFSTLKPTPWRRILRKKKELIRLSKLYQMDLPDITRTAVTANLNIFQQIQYAVKMFF